MPGQRVEVQIRAHARAVPGTVRPVGAAAPAPTSPAPIPRSPSPNSAAYLGPPPAPQTVILTGVISVELDEAVTGVAAGQTMVLYDGPRVIGSATITETSRAWSRA
jgi:tRNA-specific 2-thiouridylase